MKKGCIWIGIVLLIVLVFVGFILIQKPVVPDKPINYCNADSDCVADSCCHSSSCVYIKNVPACFGISCTAECLPGTLDCGQASCECVKNKCEVVKK
ncbi:MAG: hypothetical protein AABX66_02675 [Nanoarchaeota archaeon]